MIHHAVASVLLIGFNRPDCFKKVLQAICNSRALRIYVFVDGSNCDDAQVEGVRTIAQETQKVDPRILLNFQSGNLGCGLGPKTAIDWFFTHEQEGIILEDDCLPSPDFFRFATELLDNYRLNTDVAIISGSNLGYSLGKPNDYFFSAYAPTWGWATWRRAWKEYKFQPAEIDRSGLSSQLKARDRKQVLKVYDWVAGIPGIPHFWDYQWVFLRLLKGWTGVVPNRNLVTNIGHNDQATHTRDVNDPFANLSLESAEFPLVEGKEVKENATISQFLRQHSFPAERTLWTRIVNRIVKIP